MQGNQAQFRIVDSLRDNVLQTWRVVAHAQRIKPSDKVIIWVTGNKSGCYALIEVTSDVYIGADEKVERYYQDQGMVNEETHWVKFNKLLNPRDQLVL